MSNQTIVTIARGGMAERTIPISQIIIPDLWHITEALRKNGKVANTRDCIDLILECWTIAHSLKEHIQNQPN